CIARRFRDLASRYTLGHRGQDGPTRWPATLVQGAKRAYRGWCRGKSGADGSRTHDLLNAMQRTGDATVPYRAQTFRKPRALLLPGKPSRTLAHRLTAPKPPQVSRSSTLSSSLSSAAAWSRRTWSTWSWWSSLAPS